MEKSVDAVGMTRRIREAHAEQLKNASVEERIAFYRDKARRLHEQLAAEHDASSHTAPAAGSGGASQPDRGF